MLPEGVRHKRNGHRQPALEQAPSPGDILRLVHSDTSRPDRGTAGGETLRFARVAQSERMTALSTQAALEIDGLRSSLVEVLDRTRDALARGEMADVQRMLESFRARADLATSLVARLMHSPPSRGRHRLVDLNELVVDTLDRLERRAAMPPAADCRLDGALPLVHGIPRLLRRAVRALVRPSAEAMAEGGGVTIETSHAEGLLRGEPIVRLRVTVVDAALPATSRGVRIASRIAAEHGGVLVVERLSDRSVRFTVEMPAA